MVEERVTDGRRIAQLLASEVDGRQGDLAPLSVTDADPDAEPTPEGTHAYDVRPADGGDRPGPTDAALARAYLQPARVRLEVSATPDAALDAARERDLRARPRATIPPVAIVFVESGAQTKRAADVLGVVAGRESEGA